MILRFLLAALLCLPHSAWPQDGPRDQAGRPRPLSDRAGGQGERREVAHRLLRKRRLRRLPADPEGDRRGAGRTGLDQPAADPAESGWPRALAVPGAQRAQPDYRVRRRRLLEAGQLASGRQAAGGRASGPGSGHRPGHRHGHLGRAGHDRAGRAGAHHRRVHQRRGRRAHRRQRAGQRLENMHARVQPERYQRQLRLFHEIVGFRKLGLVYEDSPSGAAMRRSTRCGRSRWRRAFPCAPATRAPAASARARPPPTSCIATRNWKDAWTPVTVSRGLTPAAAQLGQILRAAKIPSFSMLGSEECAPAC